MAEILIPIGALFFEIITKILEIKKEKKEERNKIDFFRALLQCHSNFANKFTENALNVYVPHTVINTKKETKLKRYVTKFCLFIPEVIEYSGFHDRFPKMEDIKRHLFDFLLEFEVKGLDTLKKDYSEGVSLVDKFYTVNGNNVSSIKIDLLDFLKEEQPPSEVAPTDLFKVVVKYKNKFYDAEEITPNLQDGKFRYIDNMVSGLIKENYVPQYDFSGKKEELISWEAGAKG